MSTKKIGNVPVDKLTHKFVFGEKECLVGKFDLEDMSRDLSLMYFYQLGTELMDQIAKSGVFTMSELETIAMLDSHTFLSFFIEL